MASLRTAFLPGRTPRDGSRPRRVEGYNESTSNYTMSSGSRTRRDGAQDEPRTATRLPTKLPSRLPSGSTSSSTSTSTSTSSARRPSLTSQVPRPALDHRSQTWGSPGNNDGTFQPDLNSASSSTGREGPALKSARPALQNKRRSLLTQETESRNHSRSDSARTSSSSSNNKSRYSLEPSSGLQFDRNLTASPTDLRGGQAEKSRPRGLAGAFSSPPEHVPELANRYQHFKRPSASSDSSGYEYGYPYKLTTEDLPPPTPGFISTTSSQLSGLSASPSTRFSESPGPGPYSRDTTPTSMTSQSPGLVASSRVLPTPRGVRHTGSPAQTRPPVSAVTRRRAGSNEMGSVSAEPVGLAAVRESQTSSSSSSTVRSGQGKDKLPHKKVLTKSPSPPLRVSSAKHTAQARDGQDASGSSTSLLRRPGHGHTRSGSAGAIISSPLASSGRSLSSTRPPPIASSKATPPPRPSRDGTPDIQSQLYEAPRVIHSNLSSMAVSTERRGSEPAVAPSSLPRSTTPSSDAAGRYQYQQQSSRLGAGSDIKTSNGSSSSRSAAPTASARADAQKKAESGRSTRTPSPSVPSSFKSFGFFRRKTAPEVNTVDKEKDKKDKALRKGPAAGTGHEGYGRLGAVRRRSGGLPPSSSLTRGPGGAVSSSESLVSQNDFIDPFLRDRQNPVVIRGGSGEVVENHNIGAASTRNESSQSTRYGHSRQTSADSKFSSEMSTTSEAPPRHTLWPSVLPKHLAGSSRMRRPSDSSADGDAAPMRPTLAHRRSMQRLRSSPDAPTVRIPKPINTRAVASSSYTSLDSNILSDDSEAPPPRSDANSRKTNMPPPKKLTKPAKSPRSLWPFGRSRTQPSGAPAPSAAPTKTKKKEAVPAQVSVGKRNEAKHHAFYEMLSEPEDSSGAVSMDERVKGALRDADVLGHASPKTQVPIRDQERRPSIQGQMESPVSPELRGRAISPLQDEVVFAPPMPVSTPETFREATATPSQIPASAPTPAISPAPPMPALTRRLPQPAAVLRKGRLQPVGRIPQVGFSRAVKTEPVKKQESEVELQKPSQQAAQQSPQQGSPMSFSRPFNRMSIQMPQRIRSFLPGENGIAAALKPQTPELTQEGSTLTGGSRDISPDITRVQEFISFSNGYSPPRKDSVCTTITTSSCCSDVSVYAPAPNSTMPVPPTEADAMVEDEIWPEYNDLLMDATLRVPVSASSSKVVPFALERDPPKGKRVAFITPGDKADDGDNCLESPTLSPQQPLKKKAGSDSLSKRRNMPVAPSVYSVDLTDRLRADFVDEPDSPAATPFMAKLMEAHAERTRRLNEESTGVRGEAKEKEKETQPLSLHSSPKQPSKRGSDGSRRSQRSIASRSSRSSEEETPLAQVNLRVGSMTVSKWLTFGHVLFSPAREVLLPVDGSLKRHSILVIDGLGNDDWSFYAAETYPAANFYNLSPRAPLPRESPQQSRTSTSSAATASSSSYPRSPPNHYQIQYTSLNGKFPFGAESFTAVVFRFPAAAPESHYRNVVAEARRVLRPGGHMELSILDVDLNGMGSRARRQVRHLKERIREASPETSLGSTADLMLRLLGTAGFSEIKTCRVGVPVASSIARSNSTGSRKPKTTGERSLADMMSDESEVADEGIAKMVSRVGRWWYTRCYESAAAQSAETSSLSSGSGSGAGRKSLWHDASLMRECEEWKTSLKLMVCHARIPDGEIGRARVASI